jgi:hypothetical protein
VTIQLKIYSVAQSSLGVSYNSISTCIPFGPKESGKESGKKTIAPSARSVTLQYIAPCPKAQQTIEPSSRMLPSYVFHRGLSSTEIAPRL